MKEIRGKMFIIYAVVRGHLEPIGEIGDPLPIQPPEDKENSSKGTPKGEPDTTD